MPDPAEAPSPDSDPAEYRKAELAANYQFERCCTTAFGTVLAAWDRHLVGGSDESTAAEDVPTIDEVAAALDHGPVAPALVDWALDAAEHGSPELDAFATSLIESTEGPHTGARFVRALNAEADGRVLDAEADFTASLDADPDYTPAIYELGRFASDRGDITRAVALYRRVGSGAQAEVGFLSGLVPDYSGVGRNETCPCGSGRKFKQCHLGSSEVPPDRAALWLFQKVLGFGYRQQFAPIRLALATAAIDAATEVDERNADEIEQPPGLVERFENEPFILDLTVFESGIIDRFAAERAVLLPDAEVEMLQGWIATRRRLWEVAEVEAGRHLVFRDVISGDTVTVIEKVASKSVRPGDLLLARIVTVQGEEQLIGQPLSVGEYERQPTIDVIESGPDAEAWAKWFGWRLAAADARNEEGEPRRIRAAVLRPGSGIDAADLLDDLFERDEVDARWTDSIELDGHLVVRANLNLESDGRIVIATDSDPRMTRVLDALRAADPDLVVEGNETAPFHRTDIDAFTARVLGRS